MSDCSIISAEEYNNDESSTRSKRSKPAAARPVNRNPAPSKRGRTHYGLICASSSAYADDTTGYNNVVDVDDDGDDDDGGNSNFASQESFDFFRHPPRETIAKKRPARKPRNLTHQSGRPN